MCIRDSRDSPMRALIIDSWFDNYLGVVSLVRVVQGEIRIKEKIALKSLGKVHQVDSVGIFTPRRKEKDVLGTGEVGFVVAGIKDVKGAPVGDTMVSASNPEVSSMPGFERIKPQVYAGMFTVSADDYESFRDALAKLTLNAVSYTHLTLPTKRIV